MKIVASFVALLLFLAVGPTAVADNRLASCALIQRDDVERAFAATFDVGRETDFPDIAGLLQSSCEFDIVGGPIGPVRSVIVDVETGRRPGSIADEISTQTKNLSMFGGHTQKVDGVGSDAFWGTRTRTLTQSQLWVFKDRDLLVLITVDSVGDGAPMLAPAVSIARLALSRASASSK